MRDAIARKQSPEADIFNGYFPRSALHFLGCCHSISLVLLNAILKVSDELHTSRSRAPLVISDSCGSWYVIALLNHQSLAHDVQDDIRTFFDIVDMAEWWRVVVACTRLQHPRMTSPWLEHLVAPKRRTTTILRELLFTVYDFAALSSNVVIYTVSRSTRSSSGCFPTGSPIRSELPHTTYTPTLESISTWSPAPIPTSNRITSCLTSFHSSQPKHEPACDQVRKTCEE